MGRRPTHINKGRGKTLHRRGDDKLKVVNYSSLRKTDMNLYSLGDLKFSGGISYKLIGACAVTLILWHLIICLPAMAIFGLEETYLNLNFVIPMIVAPIALGCWILKFRIADFTIIQYIQGAIINIATPDSISLKGEKSNIKDNMETIKIENVIELED